MFLPLRTNLTEECLENLKTSTVYISRVKSLKELKEKLALLYNKNFDNIDLTWEDIKLFKLNPLAVLTDIRKEMNEKIKEVKENLDMLVDFGEVFQYLECKD